MSEPAPSLTPAELLQLACDKYAHQAISTGRRENKHPLVILFLQRKFTVQQGMNWLQERAHISDSCVYPQDVAPCDVQEIMRKAANPQT